MAVSLTGCLGRSAEPVEDTESEPETVTNEQEADSNASDAPDSEDVLDMLRRHGASDDTGESPEPELNDNGLYVLFRYNSDGGFSLVTEEGEIADSDANIDIVEKIPDGYEFIRYCTKDDPYALGTLSGADDKFLYFNDFLKIDGDFAYVAYAIDRNSYKPYLLWRGYGEEFLDTCEYYKGAFHVAVNLGTDENNKTLGKEEHIYKYNEATDSFDESMAKLDKMFGAARVRDYNVLTFTGINSSDRVCYEHAIDENGWVLASSVSDYAMISGEGEVTPIHGLNESYMYIPAYDEEHLYYSDTDYDTNINTLTCYDIETEKTKAITDGVDQAYYLGFNNGKVYYYTEKGTEYGFSHNYIYAYDADTDSSTLVYDEASVPGVYLDPGTDSFRMIGDRLWYVGFDGKDKLEWISVDAVEGHNGQLVTGPVVDEISTFKYGTVEAISDSDDCPFCGTTLFKAYAERFVLDGKYSAYADKINAKLKEVQEHFIGTDEDEGPADESDCEWHLENPMQSCTTDDFNVAAVNMICGHYMTVDMSGYWYGGGAHGYPNRNQFLFDLNTGEEVTIKDLYPKSEEEFKTLVAEKTEEDYSSYTYEESPYMAENGEMVYDSAYDEASFETTHVEYFEDGVLIVYPPYDMGSYAAGYIEVFISYEELLGSDSLP